MKKMSVWMAAAALTVASAMAGEINGAGASFPAPVYQSWTYSYSQSGKGTRVNYLSIGSGAGLNQLREGTVDFAGSDSPLTAEQQEKEGFVQFPMLTGGVVVIVNLPGVKSGELKLTREVLSDIFLGKIKGWNDPRIAEVNPGMKLPRMRVTVVRRADSSGTSFIFTDYLSKISAEWKEKVGRGSSVKWPVGIGGQKNPGVCNTVAKIRGAIGYTEYTYAVEAKLAMAQLENKAGKIVAPTVEAFTASSANADWDNAPGYYLMLTDQPGETTWPITGVTYILMRKEKAANPEIASYIQWCFDQGRAAALRMNYVPMPQETVAKILKKIFK